MAVVAWLAPAGPGTSRIPLDVACTYGLEPLATLSATEAMVPE